jgi:hypothetical protein
MEKNIVILEPSTNTHKLHSNNEIVVEKIEDGTILKLQVNGKGIVKHGEHGVLATESKHIIKYVQQELNPITNMLQNAFD